LPFNISKSLWPRELTKPNRSQALAEQGEVRIHFGLDPSPAMKVDELQILFLDLHVESRLGASDDLIRRRLKYANSRNPY
jgi:hypothetical protein